MKMNIVFAVDDKGFSMMVVGLYSVIKNNKGKIDFHVFHRNISQTNLNRLAKLDDNFSNISIKIHKIDKDRFENVKVNNKNVTTEAYYRYLIPEVLNNESRALYMDYDMMCINDLVPLYNTDLEENYLGAVADYIVENSPKFRGFKDGISFRNNEIYANSGLLLFNLDNIRNSDVMAEFWKNLKQKDKIIKKEFNIFADQTLANLTFKSKIKFLNPKYNVFTTTLKDTKQKDPVIIHFTGSYKPFTYRNKYTEEYDEIYYKYYKECLEIIGDDDGVLVKNTLKRLSREVEETAEISKDKDDQIDRAHAHIYDIEKRLRAQDDHIHAQERQLNSIISSQKRAVKLLLNKIRSK